MISTGRRELPDPPGYRNSETLHNDLAIATRDLSLSAKERRILLWLAGWDQDTVGPIISMLHKARRGQLEPPLPGWVAPYGEEETTR